jgi:stage III sporulation protein SpoIIIAA
MTKALINAIKSCGGEVDITTLSRIYCQGRGNPQPPRGLKFKEWISTIPDLKIDGETVSVPTSNSSSKGSTALIQIIKSYGGEVEISKLTQVFCNGKGSTQGIPKGVKFKTWVSNIPGVHINGTKVSLTASTPLTDDNAGGIKNTPEFCATSTKAQTTATDMTSRPIREGIILITSENKLSDVKQKDPYFHSSYCPQKKEKTHVALHCEYHENQVLHLIISANSKCYIIDCIAIDPIVVKNVLSDMLTNENLVKVVFGFYSSIKHFCDKGAVSQIRPMKDLQLAMELLTEKMNCTFSQLLSHFNSDQRLPRLPPLLLSKRPFRSEAIDNASQWASCVDHIIESPGFSSFSDETIKILHHATDIRSKQTSHQCSFDLANSYKVGSLELLLAQQAHFFTPEPIEVHTEWDEIFDTLPESVSIKIQDLGTDNISEVVFDLGEKPYCWKSSKRVFLEGNKVEKVHIDGIVEKLGTFGTDNRAGLEGQLHRISCMKNRSDEIYGLTVRIGRYVKGNADMILDLLLSNGKKEKSILFLGEPGCGKTTIVREVTRILSDNDNVCVVDTSNEIAGDGNIRHHCIGYARRMMVNTLNDQANVMIQCVQNHTPTVMVIDEIGRPMEVEAARTCKQRGVRMVASAHGSLR